MTNTKLSKKQLAVIDDLFTEQPDETAILQKHNISVSLYNKWLADENFKAEFNRRIEWLNLKSQALIARYASLAAAKLVALTESEKAETARKACLDIISLPKLMAGKSEQNLAAEADSPQFDQNLSPETAGKILEALAQ